MINNLFTFDHRQALALQAHLCLRYGHYEHAATLLHALSYLDPHNTKARLSLAYVWLAQNKTQEALALLEQQIDIADKNLLMVSALLKAKAHNKLGNRHKADIYTRVYLASSERMRLAQEETL